MIINDSRRDFYNNKEQKKSQMKSILFFSEKRSLKEGSDS